MVAVTDVAQSVGLSTWLKQEEWIVSPVADGSGTAFSDMNLRYMYLYCRQEVGKNAMITAPYLHILMVIIYLTQSH